jgi:O-methyltransferase
MSRSGAADYVVVKGWFDQTLPQANLAEPIALLRMDADWYESTKCILDNLASRVAPGGMIVVDDYYTWEGCTQAVNEFAAAHKLKIRQSTNGVAYLFIEQPIVIDGNPYLSSSSSRTSNSVARSS